MTAGSADLAAELRGLRGECGQSGLLLLELESLCAHVEFDEHIAALHLLPEDEVSRPNPAGDLCLHGMSRLTDL